VFAGNGAVPDVWLTGAEFGSAVDEFACEDALGD
jgi:hypothetical protein